MSNRQMFRPAAFAIAALALVLSACGPRSPNAVYTGPSTTTPTPSPAPTSSVKVALIVPTASSDPGAAALARSLANAGRMARDDTPSPMELQIYETAGDVTTTLAAARRATQDGAGLILGPLFAENTRVVRQVAEPAGVSVISFSTDSTVAGGSVFVSGFLPENEIARILGYAQRNGIGSVGIFYPATPFGDAALRAARTSSRDLGIAIAAARSYPRSFDGIQNSSEPFADAALGNGADAILLPEGGKGLQAVGAFMNFHRLSPRQVQYLGVGQWNEPSTFGEVALRGGWFPAPDPAAVESFLVRYTARYGARPEMLAALGYDAVKIAAILARDADGRFGDRRFSPEAIARPQGFRGAVGALRFRPDGQAERALAILEVGEDEFLIVEPAPLSFEPGA